PVIIVAAGPSLRKNAKWLKEAKGHALIVAVSRAVLYLNEVNIVPDMIVDIDETNPYSTVSDKCKKVPILCNSCIGETTFYWNEGVKLLMLDKPFVQGIKAKIGYPTIPYGYYGSCSIAAYAVFAMLGTKKIILVGQDLAVSEDGKSHAEGVHEDLEENELLPGYYGGQVKSRSDWYGFWTWYQRNIPLYPSTELINATEGGAAIPGTIQKPLKEVVDEIQKNKLNMDFLQDETYRVSVEEYDKMLYYLEEAKKEFREISAWTKKKYLESLDKLEKMTIYPLVEECMYVSDERDEWKRFCEAVEFMKNHGWRNKNEFERCKRTIS
ncbi:MAG: DUF115 domain-containing protein, partial [Clostridiales bacterium]|nr:DUF115 domain-containing protein [Clostridiales bacterium]